MTKKDKKLVADYMCWNKMTYLEIKNEELIYHTFDLNDAGFVVAEMQKRGDWALFYDDLLDTYNGLCEDGKVSCGAENFAAWLFNPENFFKAFTEWRKGIKLDPVIDKESAAYMDN